MKANPFDRVSARIIFRVLMLASTAYPLASPRLHAAAAEANDASGDWPSYYGSDAAQSYSPLNEINRHNVHALPDFRLLSKQRSAAT
jgi:glucose dehydrogenase